MGLNSLLEAVYLLHRDRLEETSNPSIDPSECMATGSVCAPVCLCVWQKAGVLVQVSCVRVCADLEVAA